MNESMKIVREHYNQSVEYEWSRIDGRPEFLLTCRMLDRYVKSGDKVLDIGGGPGRYTFYLAERGCELTLFDFSEENIKFAKNRSKDLNLPVKAICGDAREVDKHVTGQFDHVLLMGPMYHLLEERDRVLSVNSALTLLKPGGILFVAFISMSGGLVFMLREAPEQFAEPHEERFLIPLVAGENFAGSAFTEAFFINQNKVLPFMEQFNLEKLHLFGQEGVLAPNEENFMAQTPEVKDALLSISEKLYEKPEFLSWSEHLVYVGKK
ncbi:MAG: class I SAM-dependent methyltransferase [Oscillospiraceae bacterium]|nr:class I SAM-dependent methyltransferase [Oscillospiraceae bacterium]MCL2278929.1 class I SAM-dependent methyltransferase [Oscillospiraceae bacterium]